MIRNLGIEVLINTVMLGVQPLDYIMCALNIFKFPLHYVKPAETRNSETLHSVSNSEHVLVDEKETEG